jgi:hypothetical protein
MVKPYNMRDCPTAKSAISIISFRLDLAVLERHQAAQRIFVEPQLFRHQADGLATFRCGHLSPLLGGVHGRGHHVFVVIQGGTAHLGEP